jgi:hypothetical protein
MRARFATFALALALALPHAATAQSQLDTSQAQAFLGSWVVSMTSDMGAFTMNVDIRDAGGKVAASLSQADMGMQQEITDISRAGESLVLEFAGDFQGQAFTAALSFEPPTGDESAVWFDVNDGQFGMGGTGTRAAN